MNAYLREFVRLGIAWVEACWRACGVVGVQVMGWIVLVPAFVVSRFTSEDSPAGSISRTLVVVALLFLGVSVFLKGIRKENERCSKP